MMGKLSPERLMSLIDALPPAETPEADDELIDAVLLMRDLDERIAAGRKMLDAGFDGPGKVDDVTFARLDRVYRGLVDVKARLDARIEARPPERIARIRARVMAGVLDESTSGPSVALAPGAAKVDAAGIESEERR